MKTHFHSINDAMPFIDYERTQLVASQGEDFGVIVNPHFWYETAMPYQSSALVAVLCTRGKATGRIDTNPYTIRENNFCIVLPGRMMEGNYHSNNFEGVYFVLSQQFLNKMDFANFFMLRKQVEDWPIVYLKEGQQNIVRAYGDMCCGVMQSGNVSTREEVLLLLTKSLFLSVQDSTHPTSHYLVGYNGRQTEIVQQFLALLERDFKNSHEVSHYANLLCITPKYLSVVLKSVTHMSATDWIERFIMNYARARLRIPGITIQQVADELGFHNQSHFGTYFKRAEGLSPQTWRERVEP